MMRNVCCRYSTILEGVLVLLDTVKLTAVLKDDEMRICCEICSDISMTSQHIAVSAKPRPSYFLL